MAKTETPEHIKLPRRRKKKKSRYNFLTREIIVETNDDDDLDYLEELELEPGDFTDE